MHSSSGEVTNYSLCERLLGERKRLGFTQTEFADLAGVSKRSQIHYEQGRPPPADYLTAIARHGVDVLYVLTGQHTDEATRTALGFGQAELDAKAALARAQLGTPIADALLGDLRNGQDSAFETRRASKGPLNNEYASIPVHDAFLAAGYAAQNDTEAVIGHLAFRLDWLEREGISAENARIARVRGDSMNPTLQDDDMVLINTASKTVPVRRRGPEDRRLPPIYAVNTDDGPRIKRVERPEAGQMQLLSDNNEFPVEVLTGDRLKRAEIIGKVVWWGHTVRE